MPKPETLKFMKSHEWAALEGGVATVGVSDHAQHEISDVVFAEPPKLGRVVKQGEACGVIESVKAAFDIYAPLSGEIVAVNENLAKDPGLINRSAFDEGWMFKIKASKPAEAESLMDHGQYKKFIDSISAHA